jgi:hypothetical protein
MFAWVDSHYNGLMKRERDRHEKDREEFAGMLREMSDYCNR